MPCKGGNISGVVSLKGPSQEKTPKLQIWDYGIGVSVFFLKGFGLSELARNCHDTCTFIHNVVINFGQYY